MLLGCGCLLALLAGFAPRIVIILAWLFSDRWDLVWDTWVWPLLGFIFLPYTTIMYVLVWNIATGVSGWDCSYLSIGCSARQNGASWFGIWPPASLAGTGCGSAWACCWISGSGPA